jgi:integrase
MNTTDTTTQIATLDNAPGSALATLVTAAEGYASAAKATATQRAYSRAWQRFVSWCGTHGIEPCPAQPAAVALYATHLAEQGRKVATIEQAMAAVTAAHRAAGHPNPRDTAPVREALAGIRRKLGVAPGAKAALSVEQLRAMVRALPDTLKGTRDRAVLLLGFASALRRSEIAALQLRDVTDDPEGLRLTLRRSKTDQEGAGRVVGIPFGSDPATCPVRAVRAWVDAAGLSEGALFRAVHRHGSALPRALAGHDVARIVKAAAKGAGVEPKAISGHSLRAGFATAAAKAGKPERAIMRQTGHKSTGMVRRYIRDADLFTENAAVGLL